MKQIIFLYSFLSFFNLFPFQYEPITVFSNFYPMLGVYKEGYPMMNRIANYKLDKEMIVIGAPIALIKDILNKLKIQTSGKNDQQLRAEFSQLDFNNILSYLVFEEIIPDNIIYNTIFHGVLSYWRSKLQPPKRGDFNINQEMGLFTLPSGGISNASEGIPINNISQVNIHYHDWSYSPNNARFTIDDSRKVVAFWIVGLLNDIAKISLSFHVVSLDDTIRNIHSSNNKDYLVDQFKNLKEIYRNQDAQTIQEVIDFLESKSQPAVSQQPAKSVSQIIQECLETLQPQRQATASTSASSESGQTPVERIIQECLDRVQSAV